jgi:thiamine kinase-like enzyme
MWIVDWEYSGVNDPLWDLADLAVEGAFGAEEDGELLAAYFGGPPPAAAGERMVAYKAMCVLLWTLWGLIQHVNGNPGDKFWAYADQPLRTVPHADGGRDARRASRCGAGRIAARFTSRCPMASTPSTTVA